MRLDGERRLSRCLPQIISQQSPTQAAAVDIVVCTRVVFAKTTSPICIFIYIYTYIYICIRIYIFTHTHTHKEKVVTEKAVKYYIYVYLSVYIHLYGCTTVWIRESGSNHIRRNPGMWNTLLRQKRRNTVCVSTNSRRSLQADNTTSTSKPAKEAAELGFSRGKLGVFRRKIEALLTHSCRSKFPQRMFAASFKWWLSLVKHHSVRLLESRNILDSFLTHSSRRKFPCLSLDPFGETIGNYWISSVTGSS